MGPARKKHRRQNAAVSIPRSGFCGVGQHQQQEEGNRPKKVSIPRSGFCGVGLNAYATPWAHALGFNPSVGILWGGTGGCEGIISFIGQVSIPRSGFCGVGPGLPLAQRQTIVQFQSLGRDSVGWDSLRSCRPARWPAVSIPRSGFCGVGPPAPYLMKGGLRWFQSLGRDSVGWDREVFPGTNERGE